MEQSDESLPPLPLPPRMFAMGEEPVGVRVTPYHKPNCIRKILNALDPDEVQTIRETSFGKLIDIADKPPFSGRFGRFLLSRQLKVTRKHEVWFLFAGKPVRFSLREFALVTGLNCRKYPHNTKKKSTKNISEKPYWGELFGSMKEVPVSYVINMLKKKTISDKEMRIKYALLALLSAVILPTSHNPRILENYAEKIKDIDQFLAYPWGRASFELLISSIKERDEISLSQKTIALKGFVLSIQLVLTEAAPSLTRVVQAASSSGSEGDCPDDDFVDDDSEKKKGINPAHVRDIDSSSKTHVVSTIADGVELDNVDEGNHSPDPEEDILVTNMEQCIHEGFVFRKSHFVGGATVADVIRMREEAAKENNSRKATKRSVNGSPADALDADHLVSILKSSISPVLCRMEEEIKNLGQTVTNSESQMRSYIEDKFETFERNIINMLSTPCTRTHADHPHVPQAATTPSGGLDTTDINHIDPLHGSQGYTPASTKTPAPETNSFDPSNIIEGAILFANQVAPLSGDAPTAEPAPDGGANVDVEKAAEGDNDMGSSPHLSQIRLSEFMEYVDDSSAQTGSCPPDTVTQTQSPFHDNNPQPSEPVPESSTKLVNVHANLAFPKPTFSLGLTQEERYCSSTDASAADNVNELVEEVQPISLTDNQEPFTVHRKSKRQKVVTRALVGDYQCDKRILSRAWEAHVNALHRGPSRDYGAKLGVLSEKLKTDFVIDVCGQKLESNELSSFLARTSHLTAKVVDVLIHQTRSLLHAYSEDHQPNSIVLLDTKFVSLLSATFPKFSKSSKKESYRFPPRLIQYLGGDCPITEATRIYFPFNFDQKHWVGVCVDCSLSKVLLLDCNTSLRTDGMMNKEMRPISEMFPFLLRRASKQVFSKNMKALTIERPRIVPQNPSHIDSGITSILLIQAHAVAGPDVCKCITPDVLDVEAQKIAVMIYEENVAEL